MNGVVDDIKNAFKRTDNAHVQLVLINLIVFVAIWLIKIPFGLFGNTSVFDWVINELSMPASFEEIVYKPWTILTYSFIHVDIWHILGNLLTLYWFGSIITEFLGSRRLVNLYVLGAIFGGITYIIAYNIFPIFASYYQRTILYGASASVAAIVVAAPTLLPNYTVYIRFIGPVKIIYIALILIVFSWIGTLGGNAGGNFAHLGGALIGFIYIKQLKVGNDLGKPLSAILDFFKNIGKPKSNVRITYRNEKNVGTFSKTSAPDQAEVDRILDKISVSGYNSLSKEEKEELFSASQKK